MENKKLMSCSDLMEYLSLGKNKAREIGQEANAIVRIGGRVLYEKAVIDEYIEKIKKGN